MVTFGSKALLGFGFLAAVLALAYGWSSGDVAGGTVLAFVATGVILLGVAVLVADADRAPWFVPDSPLAEESAAGGRPSLPSAWPLAGAVALGVLALAAASNGVVVVAAAVLLTVVGLGWLFQQWSEDPTYNNAYAARLRDRVVLPVGLPVGVLCLVAVITISLSRIFLALPENGTRAVALAVALVIIVSGFVVAASERMARTALTMLTVFAFACVVGAGVAGIVHGERKFDKPTKPIAHAPLPPGINPGFTATTGPTATTTGASTTSAP